jgi:3-phenylpropionate/trans-cinnamate dioxygenase ferredoxin reductase component
VSSEHVVVVGASAAGVAAALALRAEGFDGRVSLVDAGSVLPYERPPLSKSAGPTVDPIPIVPESVYAEQDIGLLLGRTVTGLDPVRRRLTLDGTEELPVDSLLLATGGSPRRLGVEGEALDNVLTLRDLPDALALQRGLATGGPLVVVGGGFIGLEVAAVARRRGVEVTVVDRGEMALGRSVGLELAALLGRVHREEGVRFHFGRTVDRIRGGDSVEEVVLDDGTTLEAGVVLVGCGVLPNDALARQAGVRCDGGVLVDEVGRTDVPWVWAAGDLVSFPSRHTGRRERIEHWNVAQRRGTVAGTAMVGGTAAAEEVPYFWSDQYDHRLQMYGRPQEGDRFVAQGAGDGPPIVGFWLRGPRVVAVAGIDAPKDVRAAKVLVERGTSVDEAQLRDPSVALRSLSAREAGAERPRRVMPVGAAGGGAVRSTP